MAKQYALDDVCACLPHVLRDAEGGETVELTRDGEVIAVLLSAQEYDRLAARLPVGTSMPKRGGDFWAAVEQWRRETGPAVLEELWADGDPFAGIRDRSPDGRGDA